MGATCSRALVRHMHPQTAPSIIVAATLGVGNAILLESALIPGIGRATSNRGGP